MDAAHHARSRPQLRALDDPPGGLLLWIIVTLELVTFSMVFGVIAELRRSDAAVFAEGQRQLSPAFGVALTLFLLVSGWLVAEGVHALRDDRAKHARRCFWGGALAGAGFVVLKLVDYAEKLADGHWLGASSFWDVYVLATAFHFAHVVVGMALLMFVARRLGRSRFEDPETAVAGTGLFWHMCDVVWLFLFPLLYVGAA